jgi:hypothetical protein
VATAPFTTSNSDFSAAGAGVVGAGVDGAGVDGAGVDGVGVVGVGSSPPPQALSSGSEKISDIRAITTNMPVDNLFRIKYSSSLIAN